MHFDLQREDNLCINSKMAVPECVHYSEVLLFSIVLHDAGVVFESLEGESLEYTLRLRHEVGESDTWHTREAAFWFQRPGARVIDK